MEHQQKMNSLGKYSENMALSKYHKQSIRAVELADVWNSTELSFKRMEIEDSKLTPQVILTIEISNMVDILKADMQKIHVKYMVDYILQHYYSYSISDLTCITDRLVKNNPYGKPILQNLIYEIDQYSIEKQEYAVYQRQKENSQHKADNALTNAKILKTYDAMKQKAKEPVKTQKQKDAEAIEENNRKIETLKMMYNE